jgi:hypothetical protein
MGINPPHSAQFADSLGTGCPLPYRLHGPWMMQLPRRNCRLLSASRARICISGSFSEDNATAVPALSGGPRCLRQHSLLSRGTCVHYWRESVFEMIQRRLGPNCDALGANPGGTVMERAQSAVDNRALAPPPLGCSMEHDIFHWPSDAVRWQPLSLLACAPLLPSTATST